MRIFSSVLEAVKEVERDIFEMGINSHAPTVQDLDVRNNIDYESKELIGYGYSLTNFSDLGEVFDFFFTKKEATKIYLYCKQELEDRFSQVPLNPGRSWSYRKEYWENFLHEGKFSYTYSERLCDQIFRVMKELLANPDSRQCIVTIYDKHDDLKNIGGVARIPCSMFYHFLRRKIKSKDYLLMIYSMRSCDFYTHFPVDLWLAASIGIRMAWAIGCEFYSLTHFIDSLHAFRKDWVKRKIF